MGAIQTITAGVLRATATLFRTLVLKQISQRTPTYPKYCFQTPSGGAARVVFQALGDFPTMRELKGKVDIAEYVETGWEVANQPYHNTINVPREDLEHGELAGHTMRLQMIGDDAAVFPDKLLAARCMGGFTSKCYNGKNFFDTGHIHFKGGTKTWDNKSTLKLTEDSFNEGRVSIMSVQHENGDAFAVEMKLVLVVGPKNMVAAEKIIKAVNKAGGESNTTAGAAELIVDALITDDSWFIFNLAGVTRPFCFIESVPVELNFAQDKETTDFILNQRFLFQAYRRCQLQYLFPQVAYGSTGVDDPE